MLKLTPSPWFTPARLKKCEKNGPFSELLNASTNATQVPVVQVSPNDRATTQDSIPARMYLSPPPAGWVSDPLESWMYSGGYRPVRNEVSGTVMVEVM